MLLFFGFAIVMNLGAYWFSGDIALKMAGAREVSPNEAPELHQLVDELATYAHLPKPRVAIIDTPSPNAFATGRDANHAVVAVTTGILGILAPRRAGGRAGARARPRPQSRHPDLEHRRDDRWRDHHAGPRRRSGR